MSKRTSKKGIILPIYDFSFKAIFERNDTDVVAGFLKSILSIPEEEYEEITFDNPYLYGRTEEEKKCIVDLLLHTKSKNIIHVEMQLIDKKSFIERSVFYNSRIFSKQLNSGEEYDKLNKTISIIVTNFSLSELSSKYLRKVNLRYENGELFSDVVEFHTLEINKVPELNDGSKMWEWAKFFSSKTEEEFSVCAENNQEIKKAVIKLRELSEDERNHMIAEQIEKDRRDRVAEVALGEERGIGIGIKQNQLETAMAMLKDQMPTELIVKYSGLSEKQIASINVEQ